jgi:nicotinamide riboside kinase
MEKSSTVDSFTNYIRDQLQAERTARGNAQGMLFSDRTVIDAAAYAKVNTNLPRPFVPQYFVDMLLEVALLEASRYDLFVYCSAEFPMQPDPFRPTDEPYRQQVGDQVKAFLTEHRIRHIIATGDVETRLKNLTQAIFTLHG